MKRIVLDFDDTISFTKNRDWQHAEPNRPLIDKMRQLYLDGWQIDIFTARGSISCKTRAEADAKYRGDIEDWLLTHRVSYHTLSFDKPLATYYVDDKAMLPSEFIAADLHDLQGGLSGAEIYTDGHHVFKEDPNVFAVQEWFEKAEGIGLKVPKVEKVIGNTMTLDYIEHIPNYIEQKPMRALGLILEKLGIMSAQDSYTDQTFSDYCANIQSHLASAAGVFSPGLYGALLKQESRIDKDSFYHGDFGVGNMLFTPCNDLYLIDPIPNKFSCTEIDVAKFLASLLLFRDMTIHSDLFIFLKRQLKSYTSCTNSDTIEVLMACELVRVYKYSNEKDKVERIFNSVFK